MGVILEGVTRGLNGSYRERSYPRFSWELLQKELPNVFMGVFPEGVTQGLEELANFNKVMLETSRRHVAWILNFRNARVYFKDTPVRFDTCYSSQGVYFKSQYDGYKSQGIDLHVDDFCATCFPIVLFPINRWLYFLFHNFASLKNFQTFVLLIFL